MRNITNLTDLKENTWVQFRTKKPAHTLSEEQKEIYVKEHPFYVVERDDGAFDPCRCLLIDLEKEKLHDYCPRMMSLGGVGLVSPDDVVEKLSIEQVIKVYGLVQTASIYLHIQKHIERINSIRKPNERKIEQISVPFASEILKQAQALPSEFTLALNEIKSRPQEERLDFIKRQRYKESLGGIILAKELTQIDMISQILDLIPSSEHIELITMPISVFLIGSISLLGLIVARSDYHSLELILSKIAKDKRLEVIKANCKQDIAEEFFSSQNVGKIYNLLQFCIKMDDTLLLKKLLEALQPKERLQIVKSSFDSADKLPKLAGFQIIRELLPKIKPALFSRQIITNLDDLLWCFIQVAPHDYTAFISQAKIRIPTTTIINGLATILSPLPESERSLLIEAMFANSSKFTDKNTLLYGLRVAIDFTPDEYKATLRQDSIGDYTNTLRLFKSKGIEETHSASTEGICAIL